ncbi:hypothetical protein V6N11_036500 [Hibiscus sabdariffa]|uniref:Uncharacterized protein n=1 Tax=Hibiscus sabdariffa TaxID=183260 RepID=A0ABR2RAW8_9ROSI
MSFQRMRTPGPFLPLLLFAIMLTTVHLSSCRQLITWETQHHHHHFSATSPTVSGNQKKHTPAQDVSHQECMCMVLGKKEWKQILSSLEPNMI